MRGMSVFFRSRTIGRRGERSRRRSAGVGAANRSTTARSRAMSASGFVRRSLARRRRATAVRLRGSQTRWNPPSPLTARILPARMRAAASGIAAAELAAGPGVAERQARPAGRAGDGLGVVAAVERVLVFPAAVRAHREPGHRRARPVVGQAADDGVAGPAVGAVREGIAVAALARRLDLLEAVGAGGDVGGDEDEASGLPGLADLEARGGFETGAGRTSSRSMTARGGSPFRRAAANPPRTTAGRPLDVDLDARAGVLDPAVEPEAAGEPVDVGPEADALDDAEDGQARRRPAAARGPRPDGALHGEVLDVGSGPGGVAAVETAAVVLAVEAVRPAEVDALLEAVLLLEIGLEEGDAGAGGELAADAVHDGGLFPGAEAHDRGEGVEARPGPPVSAVRRSLAA